MYPRGERLGFKWWVTGHNLDPLYPWSVGCQMAAINMQYRDRAYRVNAARFSLNRCPPPPARLVRAPTQNPNRSGTSHGRILDEAWIRASRA